MLLGNVVAQAGLHSIDSGFFVAGCGEHNYRQMRVTISDVPADLGAAEPWIVQVGNNRIKVPPFHRLIEFLVIGDSTSTVS